MKPIEPDLLATLIDALPGIITSIGVIVIAYYKLVVQKKEGDQKSISQLQEHVQMLMSRNEKQDEINYDLQKQNADQLVSLNAVNTKLEQMKLEMDQLKNSLESERREKHFYKEKYEKERTEKIFILEENQKMKKDIEALKAEISTLKAQLGIAQV